MSLITRTHIVVDTCKIRIKVVSEMVPEGG